MENVACTHCSERGKNKFTHDFTMAFQPIFDVETGDVFAHEALVRGRNGEGAGSVLSKVTEENQYSFDQSARVTAIRLAAEIGTPASVSINFMPNAVYDPRACIQKTLWAAERYDFPTEKLIFEFTESEQVRDKAHLVNIISTYKNLGFRTAIDDFGAGYSGLSLLADVVPDIIKIDRDLIIDIHNRPTRQQIVRAIVGLSRELGVEVLAEGIETEDELDTLVGLGVQKIQGFLLGRPALEAAETLPAIPIGPIARSA